MAKAVVLILSLLFLATTSLADGQQQPRQRSEQCRIENLEALEPTRQLESEAGLSEFWDHSKEQFQCAGVSAVRHTIQPKGLLLPSSSNSPRLVYVIKGEGIGGLVVPGCPESYSSFQESSRRRTHGRREGRQQQQQEEEEEEEGEGDRHQKVHHLRRGELIAIPAGVPVWAYNNGDRPLVVVSIMDTGNYVNQLDNTPRRFFVGGSAPQQSVRTSETRESETQRRRSHGLEGGEQSSGNIFDGFDTELLAKALGVKRDTASKLQSREESRRGMIIRVEEGLHAVRPMMRTSEYEEEERRERSGRKRRSPRGEERDVIGNGVEELLCNLKFKLNIGDPQHSDVYSREAGYLTTVNSVKLHILKHLQLSAQKLLLRRDAIAGPSWNMNSHSIEYVTKGSARVQIVDSSGKSVMDERVKEGQILVIPQNYVVMSQAEDDEFECVNFQTSDVAVWNNLAGKGSTLQGIPVDVLANSHQMTREEARMVKQGRREELALFAPREHSKERRAVE